MKSKLKVMFYLKKNETKKDELSPVMGRIQVGKTMSQFSLKLKADANLWDTKVGCLVMSIFLPRKDMQSCRWIKSQKI